MKTKTKSAGRVDAGKRAHVAATNELRLLKQRVAAQKRVELLVEKLWVPRAQQTLIVNYTATTPERV